MWDRCRRGEPWRGKQRGGGGRLSQLCENKQSSWNTYSLGNGLSGEPTCAGLVPPVLGKPPPHALTETLVSFEPCFSPKGFNTKPSGLITYRPEADSGGRGPSDSGNSYRRTHMFRCVLLEAATPNKSWMSLLMERSKPNFQPFGS